MIIEVLFKFFFKNLYEKYKGNLKAKGENIPLWVMLIIFVLVVSLLFFLMNELELI